MSIPVYFAIKNSVAVLFGFVLLIVGALMWPSPIVSARLALQGTPHVTIRATTPTAFESLSGEGVFLITRDGSTAQPLTVHLTIGGTATNGVDYQTIPNEVQIPAGATSTEVRVKPVDDTTAEPDELVTIGLADVPVNSVSNNTLASVTIKDNDTVVEITATDPNGAEAGQRPIVFRVTRSGNTRSELTVDYAVNSLSSRPGGIQTTLGDGSVRTISDGTSNTIIVGETTSRTFATSGSDFTPLPGNITFQVGESSKVINVTPIDDTTIEPTESVSITLLRSRFYTLGTNVTASGTIQDNDQPTPPVVSMTVTQGNASEEGPVNGVVTITRSIVSSQPLTVLYSINSGGINVPNPATNGVDFETLSGQAVIPAGAASTTILIKPVDDNQHEPEERVGLQLVASPSYTIQAGSDQAIIKIKDHHGP